MISFDVSRLFLPKLCLAFSILLLFLSEDVGGCGDSDYTESDFSVINPAVGRSKREAGEEDAARKACQPGDPAPPTRYVIIVKLS